MSSSGDDGLERTVTSTGVDPAGSGPDNESSGADDAATRIFSDLFCPICGGRFPGGLTVCSDDGVPLVPVGTGDDLSGTVLNNKYVLVQLIGRGGFGNVYRATHKLARTEIAIKVIKDELRDNDKAVRQFLKETRALMSIQSMHVVTVHDVDRDADGRIYIVMELLRGRDLEDHLKSEYAQTGRMPWDEVGRIVLQVCDALDCAHEKGIVHRDLKPGNVMMVQGRGGALKAKVVDFGIASLAQTENMDLTTMDAVPRVIGTPSFMSPEQAKGQSVDHRADLYSLGAMIYRLVCGCKPFDAKTDQGMLIAHVIEKPKPIRERCPELDVPEAFDSLVMQLMSKTPDERPSGVAEVVSRLEAFLPRRDSNGAPAVDGDRNGPAKGGVWKIVVAAAVLLVAAAGIGAWLFLSDTGDEVVVAGTDVIVASAPDSSEAAPVAPEPATPAEAVPAAAVASAPASPVEPSEKKAAAVVDDSPAAQAPAARTASAEPVAPEPVAPAPAAATAAAAPEPSDSEPGPGIQAPEMQSGQAAGTNTARVRAAPMKAAIPVNRSAARPGKEDKKGSATSPDSGTRKASSPGKESGSDDRAASESFKPTPPPEKKIEASKPTRQDVDELEELEDFKPKAKKGTKRSKLDSDSDEAFDELNF